MTAYFIRRLSLMIPTLCGILLLSSMAAQFTPGGPVECVLAALSGSGTGQPDAITSDTSRYRGARGLDPAFIKRLEKPCCFDKPAYERFFLMVKGYVMLDFGRGFSATST